MLIFLRRWFKTISPFRIITASFITVILLGSLLLYLPVSTREAGSCSYLDALFTSVSAVCVTGLVTRNTATFWTPFGKSVILFLIQVGGLGVITVIIAASIFTGKKIGLRQRDLMQNAINAPELGGIIRFTRFMLFFTFAAEAAGVFLLLPVFTKPYGFTGGMKKAVFHSISAFCNAGFDLLGEQEAFSSLTGYHGNILLNVVIMLLIISGGLGFLSWQDILKTRGRWNRMKFQTRIILLTSGALILLPALFFFAADFREAQVKDRILYALFQSVTTRTAGFNTADLTKMGEGSRLLMIVLMLIGGSPGSTAGGLKTTTLAVILVSVFSSIRQEKSVHALDRSVSLQTVQTGFTLMLLYLALFLAGSILICTWEGFPILDCMFETASALGTVGLTLGITPSLGAASRILLILYMYFGRVGGLTLAYAVLTDRRNSPGRFPEEKIMIG